MTKRRQNPALDNQYSGFHLGLVPRLADSGRNDDRAVVISPVAVGRVEVRFVIARILDSRLPVVRDRYGRNTAIELDGPAVRTDPGGQIPLPGRLGIGVVTGSQNGDEDERIADLTGFSVDNRHGLPGMVDEHFLAGPVCLAQYDTDIAPPAPV